MTATAEGDKYVIKLDDGRFVKCKPHKVSATKPGQGGSGGGVGGDGGGEGGEEEGRLTPRLTKLMNDIRLTKYSLAVFEEGYIGIEDLHAATDEEVAELGNEVGMRKPEIKRLMRVVRSSNNGGAGELQCERLYFPLSDSQRSPPHLATTAIEEGAAGAATAANVAAAAAAAGGGAGNHGDDKAAAAYEAFGAGGAEDGDGPGYDLLTAARRTDGKGATARVQELIAQRAPLNQVDAKKPRTPLMWTIVQGNHQSLLELLKANAETAKESKQGHNALSLALEYERLGSFRTLLGFGANAYVSCVPLLLSLSSLLPCSLFPLPSSLSRSLFSFLPKLLSCSLSPVPPPSPTPTHSPLPCS